MCIVASTFQKNKLLTKVRRHKKRKIRVWKGVDWGWYSRRKYPTSPMRQNYKWTPGIHIEDCSRVCNGDHIYKGFFVCLTYQQAKEWGDPIPLYVDINDLVAVGSHYALQELEAVFSKVEFRMVDYLKYKELYTR